MRISKAWRSIPIARSAAFVWDGVWESARGSKWQRAKDKQERSGALLVLVAIVELITLLSEETCDPGDALFKEVQRCALDVSLSMIELKRKCRKWM